MVPTTLGRQTQPQMDSPARRGRSRSPMDMAFLSVNMASMVSETTTIVETLIRKHSEYGVTQQTPTYGGTTVLCLHVCLL